jgi:hypothetical protein
MLNGPFAQRYSTSAGCRGDGLEGYRIAVNLCISSGGHPKSCGPPAGRVAGQGYS